MKQTVGQTWEQAMLTQGQLLGCRDSLRAFLEARFGTLPEDLVQRIETTEDLERLRACVRQAVRITSLDELQL